MPRIGLIACALLFVLSPSWNYAQSANSFGNGLGMPMGVTTDKFGNVLVAATKDCVILLVDPKREVYVLAGNGSCGYSGDGGRATSAELNHPAGLAIDSQGNIYIADTFNNVIRKVDTSGTITTAAGNGKKGFSGDGGPATSAKMDRPQGVSIEGNGNMFIADTENNRIRKVNKKGIISTFLGNGHP
jgi:trimeric autotransporter adhesin